MRLSRTIGFISKGARFRLLRHIWNRTPCHAPRPEVRLSTRSFDKRLSLMADAHGPDGIHRCGLPRKTRLHGCRVRARWECPTRFSCGRHDRRRSAPTEPNTSHGCRSTGARGGRNPSVATGPEAGPLARAADGRSKLVYLLSI